MNWSGRLLCCFFSFSLRPSVLLVHSVSFTYMHSLRQCRVTRCSTNSCLPSLCLKMWDLAILTFCPAVQAAHSRLPSNKPQLMKLSWRHKRQNIQSKNGESSSVWYKYLFSDFSSSWKRYKTKSNTSLPQNLMSLPSCIVYFYILFTRLVQSCRVGLFFWFKARCLSIYLSVYWIFHTKQSVNPS